MKRFNGYIKVDLNPELRKKLNEACELINRLRQVVQDLEYMDKLVLAPNENDNTKEMNNP